jgi:hypothetical protein
MALLPIFFILTALQPFVKDKIPAVFLVFHDSWKWLPYPAGYATIPSKKNNGRCPPLHPHSLVGMLFCCLKKLNQAEHKSGLRKNSNRSCNINMYFEKMIK